MVGAVEYVALMCYGDEPITYYPSASAALDAFDGTRPDNEPHDLDTARRFLLKADAERAGAELCNVLSLFLGLPATARIMLASEAPRIKP